MSNRSIYIIAFNSVNMIMTRIRYWLQQLSASVFAPVIFLVGTRKDEIPQEDPIPGFVDEWNYGTADGSGFLQRISNQLRQKFSASYRTIRGCIFVSNNTGDGLNTLTSLLVENAVKQPTIKNEVPTSYLVLDRLVAKQKLDNPIVSWKNYLRWVMDAGIESKTALNITEFLHGLSLFPHLLFRFSIQSNPIQSNPIQSNPIQSNPIQSNPIQSNPIQSIPIHQSRSFVGAKLTQKKKMWDR